ncbi:hypothetical protein ABZY81_43450 [Streptomyces sp. NPDC006514]|uniref:hypothetical protein n=1 Tax=Streptomyces sp. NPDC006514 TaxID=3154308 RepID=UPI0033A178F7
MQIVVAGQGYVGLPLAVRAAEVGHRVVGYDVDPHRVQQLDAGDRTWRTWPPPGSARCWTPARTPRPPTPARWPDTTSR